MGNFFSEAAIFVERRLDWWFSWEDSDQWFSQVEGSDQWSCQEEE